MILLLITVTAGWLALDRRKTRAAEPTAVPLGVHEGGARRLQDFGTRALQLFNNDIYAQSVKDVRLEAREPSQEDREADRFLKLSSVLAVTSGLSAVVCPPLLFLHILPLVYITRPMYRQGFQDLVQRRKITTTVVDVAVSLGSLVFAPFQPTVIVVSAAGSWVYALTNKIVLRSKDTTRKRLTNLFGEQPRMVWILKDGVEIEVSYESLVCGDTVVVQAGEIVPVDGVLTEGQASVDQRMLTGEAQPVEKGPGDTAFAATVVLMGKLYLRVDKIGEDTIAAQIGKILKNTSDFASSVQLRGKEMSDKFAAPTLGLGCVAAVIVGPSAGLAVLLSGVGYSMRILGPLSVLNNLLLAAEHGILIKDGRALERIGAVDTVVFDKTGTLTLQQPYLAAVHTYSDISADELLTYAAAAESRQTHPIAKAILCAAGERGLAIPPTPIDASSYEVGYGIKVSLSGNTIDVGSRRYLESCADPLSMENDRLAEIAHGAGASLVYVAINGIMAGVLELHTSIRPEARRIVRELRQRGLALYIISGDHERATRHLAEELGIGDYFAETLPENKADHISRLQANNRRVCFVGDGINDAIALKTAHVSVSLKGASTAATDTAQVILMDESLTELTRLFSLADAFERNMKRNLLTSVVPGVIVIGGAFTGLVEFASAMALTAMGSFAGVVNSTYPLFQTEAPTTKEEP
jgi:heavy metal translocating P-type ATPase